MRYKKRESKVEALFWGALLILFVVPVSLSVLKAVNNGVGIALPYVLWILLYAVYALSIVFGG